MRNQTLEKCSQKLFGEKRSKGTLTKKRGEVQEPARGISYLFEILEYDR